MQAATSTETFRHALRVYWEDTDASDAVFYANHLKFFERTSIEWRRTRGFSQQQMRRDDGVMFVVEGTALRSRRAARLDDLLDVTVAVGEAGRASMRLAQQAWRDGELLAEGEIRIGCVAAQVAASTGFRPCRVPAAILEKIQ